VAVPSCTAYPATATATVTEDARRFSTGGKRDAHGAVGTLDASVGRLGKDKILDPGAGAGSDDVGILATSSGAPLSYGLLAGADLVSTDTVSARAARDQRVRL